ncbi:MAG TPA: ABC transporter ATP-binding protein [Blastocatellia bacterium]|nr:ABC transporter ATP-binding protein [Blastocatellia bacterium]
MLLFVINVIGHAFSVLADNRTTWLGVRIEADLIQSTYGHVLRLPLSVFGQRTSGAVAKQIDQSDQVAPVISAFAQEIAPEVIRRLGVFIIMATQSWRLTLLAFLLIPPYLWVARRSAKRLESGLEGYYEMWENLSGRIQDGVAAIKTVKLSGAEPRETALFREQSRIANEDYLRRSYLGNRYHLIETVLSYGRQTIVFLYGGWLVYQHQLTPGDVVMFATYLDSLFAPIDALTSLSVTLQQQIVSLRRALRLLVTGGEESGGAELVIANGRVEFDDVQFGYAPERAVLRGLSLTLEPGKVTALVGPSGAGKTTAADLLLKLYEAQAGEIRIDGQALATLDPSSVRRALGVVAADGAVFRAHWLTTFATSGLMRVTRKCWPPHKLPD